MRRPAHPPDNSKKRGALGRLVTPVPSATATPRRWERQKGRRGSGPRTPSASRSAGRLVGLADADGTGVAEAVAHPLPPVGAGTGAAVAVALGIGTGVAEAAFPLVGTATGLALALAIGTGVAQDGVVGAADGLAVGATGAAEGLADLLACTASVPAVAADAQPGQQRHPRHGASRPSRRHARPSRSDLHMLLLVTIRPTAEDTCGSPESCAVRSATFCPLRPYKHERGTSPGIPRTPEAEGRHWHAVTRSSSSSPRQARPGCGTPPTC